MIFLLECASQCIFSHHWYLEYHSICQKVWPKQTGCVHELELPPGKTARYDLCSCTDLRYQQVPRLGLTFCCHQLEITKNIFFELVFCKWSPMGQWKMCINSGDKPGLRVEQAVAKHQKIVIPHLQASQRVSGPPRWTGRDQSPGWRQQQWREQWKSSSQQQKKGRFSTENWYWDLL